MEGLVEDLARGNVVEVKVMLASIVAALACYQLALIAVGYGKLRVSFLGSRAASGSHRAAGDAIVVITVTVAVMCLSYGEFEEKTAHVVAASALLVVLALKIAVVRWWHRLHGLLPVLGISVWTLFALTFATSAGDFLASR